MEDIIEMNLSSVGDIIHRGGTIFRIMLDVKNLKQKKEEKSVKVIKEIWNRRS